MKRKSTFSISPPSKGEIRYRLQVAYDGTTFHGFAINPDVKTIEGLLTESITKVLGSTPVLTCAGRTDAGVHAKAQIVSFDSKPFDPVTIQRSLNKLCAPYVAISSIEEASDDFSARFSALGRTYRYRVLNQEQPDPFLARYSWHVRNPASIERMNHAGQFLIGEHDFSSFCRKRSINIDGKQILASLTREVTALNWEAVDENILELWITANAFCHQMVRSITGTLIDIGTGKIEQSSIIDILDARDRNLAGQVAPPHGLTLWKVDYQ